MPVFTVQDGDTKTRVLAIVDQWLAALNAGEVERRIAVNEKHLAEHGRTLYPADEPQYAYFTLDKPGRKFTRVVMAAGGQRSVHAFFDARTGDVYKSASWKAPAAVVRFNLLDDASRADMFAKLDWAGGYLYLR